MSFCSVLTVHVKLCDLGFWLFEPGIRLFFKLNSENKQKKIFRFYLKCCLPLATEVHRFKHIPVMNQICEAGELDEAESESGFLLCCTNLTICERCYFTKTIDKNPEISRSSDEQKPDRFF